MKKNGLVIKLSIKTAKQMPIKEKTAITLMVKSAKEKQLTEKETKRLGEWENESPGNHEMAEILRGAEEIRIEQEKNPEERQKIWKEIEQQLDEQGVFDGRVPKPEKSIRSGRKPDEVKLVKKYHHTELPLSRREQRKLVEIIDATIIRFMADQPIDDDEMELVNDNMKFLIERRANNQPIRHEDEQFLEKWFNQSPIHRQVKEFCDDPEKLKAAQERAKPPVDFNLLSTAALKLLKG